MLKQVQHDGEGDKLGTNSPLRTERASRYTRHEPNFWDQTSYVCALRLLEEFAGVEGELNRAFVHIIKFGTHRDSLC